MTSFKSNFQVLYYLQMGVNIYTKAHWITTWKWILRLQIICALCVHVKNETLWEWSMPMLSLTLWWSLYRSLHRCPPSQPSPLRPPPLHWDSPSSRDKLVNCDITWSSAYLPETPKLKLWIEGFHRVTFVSNFDVNMEIGSHFGDQEHIMAIEATV